MTNAWPVPIDGGCACGQVRYRVDRVPLFLHCCNCTDCQRETGSAFALNAMIETAALVLLPPRQPGHRTTSPARAGRADGTQPPTHEVDESVRPVTQPLRVVLPSASGRGQLTVRCPRCYVVVWSHYGGAGPAVAFLRAGTVDRRGRNGEALDAVLRPDICIYTRSKQAWVTHDSTLPCVDEYYDRHQMWSDETTARFEALLPRTQAWKDRGSRWEELDEGEGVSEIDGLVKGTATVSLDGHPQ